MTVEIAQNAGFCFGVKRATDRLEETLAAQKNERIYTLGALIHNDIYNRQLAEQGVKITSIDEIPALAKTATENAPVRVFVRAHGIPKEDEALLARLSAEHPYFFYEDCTCPFVKKIHKIAKENSSPDHLFLLSGCATHPEVIGIVGQCKNGARVIGNASEASEAELSGEISVVVQTTFNGRVFEEINKIIKEKNAGAIVYNTMCPATNIRQKEIATLSQKADYVVVLGGKKSSNSLKLCQIASANTKSVLVEKIEEIPLLELQGLESVVVCGGSSTPYELIESAANHLKNHLGAEIIKLKD